ncbi:MAG: metallophosphoesterase [Candidatus Aenigmarchaeota archaeon]|nr:metallophosphoesterase [Candidatus Aenigmarchaeota archaeon]
MERKCRILAASDLHGDHRIAQRLAEKSVIEDVDLVLLCGDLTHFDTNVEGMIGPFVKKGKPVFFVPGNHDSLSTAEFLARKYNVKNIDGYGIMFHDIAFFGCGGANIGPHLRDEDEITEYLERSVSSIEHATKKVMVTHVHPSGGTVEELTFPGSDAVRRAIEKFKPDIHVSGHIHDTEGTVEKMGKTTVICTGKYGTIFEI